MQLYIILFSLSTIIVLAQSSCKFFGNFSGADIYRTGGQDVDHWFNASVPIKKFTIDVDVPETSGGEWVDVIWETTMARGRATVFGDLVIYKNLLPENDGQLRIRMSHGFGNPDNIPLKVHLVTEQDAVCKTGRVVARPVLDNESTRAKRSGEVATPRWVALDEVASAEYAFLWPINSRYGINSIALAMGAEIGDNHEYLQLSEFERPVYSLLIPGMHVSGPNYADSTDGGHYYQGRQLFKYSKRDAAWVMWNYQEKKPMWNGDHDKNYWKYRTCAVPINQPGLVFDNTEK